MNAYSSLPSKSFWKLAVAEKSIFDIDELWDPKFDIRTDNKIVTYGSCFAQHIGNVLKHKGYQWLVTEQPPHGLSDSNIKAYGYNIFSSRTGNIYTTSLLKQWTSWAFESCRPIEEVWEKDGRYFDPFRPRIEPKGFISPSETINSRVHAIDCFKASIVSADYFVFTLGLTESWINHNGGYEYPVCPGTIAGQFDPREHRFLNQEYSEVLNNLVASIRLMKEANKHLRFILTVSPVPLTATKSDNHVVVATMHSKSILRAVAGQLSAENPDIDYFPSYEILNSPVFRGIFFQPNQRTISQHGVNFVMESFFKEEDRKFGRKNLSPGLFATQAPHISDTFCEEALLAAARENQ